MGHILKCVSHHGSRIKREPRSFIGCPWLSLVDPSNYEVGDNRVDAYFEVFYP